MDPQVSGPEDIKLKESLKLAVGVLFFSQCNVEKKKNIETYLHYLKDMVDKNKQRNEELTDGVKALDDMYLDVITRNHISSVGSQFQKDITIDEEPFYIETEAPCDLEAQPPSRLPSSYPHRSLSVALGQALAPFVINTPAPCDMPPAPTCSIDVKDKTIDYGETTTVTLIISNATSGEYSTVNHTAAGYVTDEIDTNILDNYDEGGITFPIQPHITTTLKLVVWNSTGARAEDSATITVNNIPPPPPPPKIPKVEIKATNNDIYEGETTQLHLKLKDATRGRLIEIVADSAQKKIIEDNISSSEKTVTVSPEQTTIYELIAWNEDEKASATVIISVSEMPSPSPDPEPGPSAELKATSLFIDTGEIVSLTPKFDNGTPEIFTQTDADVGKNIQSFNTGQPLTSGTPFDVQPSVNTRYILTVKNSSNKVETASVKITINTQGPQPVLQPPPKPTVELKANIEIVHKGASVILTPIFNIGTAEIYEGETLLSSTLGSELASNSHITVRPQVTTTYTLIVRNGMSEAKANVYIIVVPQQPENNSNITASRILVNPGDLVILTPTFTSGQAKIYETKELNGTETTHELQISASIRTGQEIEVRPQVNTTYFLDVTDDRMSEGGRAIKHREGSSVTVNIKKPLIQQQSNEYILTMPVPCY
jgi:hypothetical protein